MRYISIVIFLIMQLSINAQIDSIMTTKVLNMMDLTGISKNIKSSLGQLISNQEENNTRGLGSEFWKEYQKEVIKNDFKELKLALIP